MSIKIELKFNLDRKGLDTLFKPYQIKALKILEAKQPCQTLDIWTPLKHEISRASIINFLKDMADRGYLTNTKASGKGGMRPVYRIKAGSLDGLTKQIKQDLLAHIEAEL